MYKAKVSWYNDYEDTDEVSFILVCAESWETAMKYIVEAFDFIMSRLGNPLPANVADLIRQTIKATETQDAPTEMAARFHQYDCQVIIRGNYVDLLEYEFQIFREFQYLNMVDYRKGRSAFFQRFPKRFPQCKATIDFLVEYLERRRPHDGQQPIPPLYVGASQPPHRRKARILSHLRRL